MKSLCVVLGLLLLGMTAPCVAQQPLPETLTDAQTERLQSVLQQASAKDFLKATHDLWKRDRDHIDPAARETVSRLFGERSRELLDTPDAFTTLSTQDLHGLAAWAAPTLTQEQKASLLNRIDSELPGGTRQSFSQLSAKVAVLDSLVPRRYADRSPLREEIAQWIETHDLSESPLKQVDWLQRTLGKPIRGEDGFSVAWTGFIRAPRDGDYVFSTSSWSVWEHVDELHEQELSVEVAGKTVIDSQHQDWPAESDPVALVGGEWTPIRVEFSYRRNDAFRTCPVLLYWKGPGIAKAIVPASCFSYDGQGAPGLAATYSWKEKTGDGVVSPVSAEAIDPNIEFIWNDGFCIGGRSGSLGQVGAELAERWAGSQSLIVRDLARRPSLVSSLSCQQLSRCVQSVIDQRGWQGYSSVRFWRFWTAVRCADTDLATDLLGAWMQERPDVLPELVLGEEAYYGINRKSYRRFAINLGHENPAALKLFEEYLETPEGRCVLPVAYTCAYAYLQEGRIEAWIEQLDARLEDEKLAGDQRVNWLLARAMAEEIRWEPATPEVRTVERRLAGAEWLQEALLVVETPAIRARVQRELAARFAALGDWRMAEDAIAGHPDAARLNKTIGELQQQQATREEEERTKSDAAYVAELERRRQRAADRGDSTSERRYAGLISSRREDK